MTVNSDPRGTFNHRQTEQLLRPVNPKRVVSNAHTKPHLSQQDVVAHLVRIFGFGRFDVEVQSSECIFEDHPEGRGWDVGYRALVRLIVRDEQQRLVAYFDGGSTGEAQNQPNRASAHDLAYKSALSTSLKRAAIYLGDQFGLSLYNKGQLRKLVGDTLVDGSNGVEDVQDGVEQQEVDGGRESEMDDTPIPEAEAPKRKTPTKGRQGTKTAERPAVVPQEQPEPAPEPRPEPVAATVSAGEVSVTIAAGEPITDGPMEGLVPTPEQVAGAEANAAARQHIEQARAQGVDVSVADEIATAEIPAAPEPEPVVENASTGEVAESPEEFAAAAWRHALTLPHDGEQPAGAELSAFVMEHGRTRADMMAVWKMAETAQILTTEMRVALINAGHSAAAREAQASQPEADDDRPAALI